MTKVKVKKTRKFHSAEAWIVKDCQGNYVTSVEFLRDTPKNVKTAYYNKPEFGILKFGQICVLSRCDHLQSPRHVPAHRPQLRVNSSGLPASASACKTRT